MFGTVLYVRMLLLYQQRLTFVLSVICKFYSYFTCDLTLYFTYNSTLAIVFKIYLLYAYSCTCNEVLL